MHSSDDKAVCRGCGLVLRGEPYWAGKPAYHPDTGVQVKVNYYGGFVCSRNCDIKASLELEQSMPGHGFSQKRIGPEAQRRVDHNWPERENAR